MEELRSRAKEKVWPDEVQKAFDKEILRLSRLTPSMPDYAIVINYIEWLLDLPWQYYGDDSFEFSEVQKILDEDHYGLER